MTVERVIENVKTVMDKVRVALPEVLSATGVSVGGGSVPVVMSATESVVEEVQEPGFADRMQTAIKETGGNLQAALNEARNDNAIATVIGPGGTLFMNIAEPIVAEATRKHEGSVLATVFSDEEELGKHKDAIPGQPGYEFPAVSLDEFLDYARGKSFEELQNEAGNGSNHLYSERGPEAQYRFVVDPKDPNRIIDMRHFFAVGARGELYGLGVEILQSLPEDGVFPLKGDHGSAFDSQDFFSNALGSNFFQTYDSSREISQQLREFLIQRQPT